MRTVVLLGNFGATNIGDEALLESMLHLFRLRFKPSAYDDSLHLHVLSSDPVDTEHRYAASYECSASPLFPGGPRSLLTSLIPALRGMRKQRADAEYILFGGGGLFTDHSSLYPVIFWWLQFWAAKLLIGKPVHIVGQSFGPLERPFARMLTRHVLTHAASITVRDEASKVLAEQLGGRDVQYLPDLAFFYPLSDIAPHTRGKTLRIALSLRPWHDTHLWIEHLLETISSLAKDGPIDIGLFPMQMIREEDVSLLEGFSHRLARLDNVSVSMHQLANFGELSTHLAAYDIAIGQRLHFLICSLRTHLPCIALSYSNKVSAIMQHAGMPTLQQPESEALLAGIHDILENYEEHAGQARHFCRTMKDRQPDMETDVFADLAENY